MLRIIFSMVTLMALVFSVSACSSLPHSLSTINREQIDYFVSKSVELEDECARLYEEPYEERRIEQLVIYHRLGELAVETQELFQRTNVPDENRRALLVEMYQKHKIPMILTKSLGDEQLDRQLAKLVTSGKAGATDLWKVQPGIVANADPQNPLIILLAPSSAN